MKILAILSIVLAIGCRRHEPDPAPPMPSPELLAKVDAYRALLETRRDTHGFLETDTCDSIHWSALAAAVTRPIDIVAAIDPEGAVHRRPTDLYPECYPDQSDSAISNDALLMVLIYGQATHDLALLDRVFAYGLEHDWTMGTGDPFATIMRPTLRSLYARAIKALGGADHIERLAPTFLPTIETGYQAHLEVLGILSLLHSEGSLPESGVGVLRGQVERQPRNALFQAALGRFDPDHRVLAQALLLNGDWWPSDRLPTSGDRCESWLTQRDYDPKDWGPCAEQGRLHSGGDFLFAAAILKGDF